MYLHQMLLQFSRLTLFNNINLWVINLSFSSNYSQNYLLMPCSACFRFAASTWTCKVRNLLIFAVNNQWGPNLITLELCYMMNQDLKMFLRDKHVKIFYLMVLVWIQTVLELSFGGIVLSYPLNSFYLSFWVFLFINLIVDFKVFIIMSFILIISLLWL